ncbi:MAG TPA: hypothetical protein VMS74_03525 [Acidimicrobiia bacterium]|nr:hypothetical protein [Acidimicrobiia bacterium]
MSIVKFSIGVLGALTVAIGATLVAVAVGLFTWVGSGPSVQIPETHITTTNGMIVAEDIDFLFDDARFVPDLGTASLRIRTADGGAVFAGITDQLTADRFLGADVDPSTQGFWLASGTGDVADLVWDIQPGNWTFVVAGTDGLTPSSIVIDGELSAAPFRLAAGTVAGLGVATGVAGGLLLMAAFGIGRNRPPAPTRAARVPATAGV